jgi:putative transposase
MLRPRRKGVPGGYYHALNRGNGRSARFHKEQDPVAILQVLAEPYRRGGGHVYQGRFKSFPIRDDLHFLTVGRYVEANP